MDKKPLSAYFTESEEIKKKWGWFFILGLLLIFFGVVVIHSAFTATIFSVLTFGFLLIGASIVHILQTLLTKDWSGIFLSILLAVLYGVTGVLCVTNPAVAAVDLTLLIAVFCFIGGLFKMIASLIMRFHHWGWVFFNGLITFILGILIYKEWPLSGLWVLGTFVGIDMILAGWSWLVLSLAARKHTE